MHGVGKWNVDGGRGYYIRGRKRRKRQAICINSAFCNVVCLTYGYSHQETDYILITDLIH